MSADAPSSPRLLLAEFVATAVLLVAVVGSGIMAERLAGGNVALALLANALATVGALYVLIEVFGPVSGAHMNPAVSLGLAMEGRMPWRAVAPYASVQCAGAIIGVWLAHAMFQSPILQLSSQARIGSGQVLAEVVATAGLLLVVLRAPPYRVAPMVAAYIGAAYWFTASTSFANPAVTLGRLFTDSFSGIAPPSAPGFLIGQGLGVMAALLLHRILGPAPAAERAAAPAIADSR
ncbi:MIP/aquaporin family protein [Luteimonas vadosa]|uniref:MIP/aquaporin family protein n=1 Tax=Luteimonas vadosa TaxID=1165507 RepID=A0ABP9E3B5_9GAMM